jgi:hypothetical protein
MATTVGTGAVDDLLYIGIISSLECIADGQDHGFRQLVTGAGRQTTIEYRKSDSEDQQFLGHLILKFIPVEELKRSIIKKFHSLLQIN